MMSARVAILELALPLRGAVSRAKMQKEVRPCCRQEPAPTSWTTSRPQAHAEAQGVLVQSRRARSLSLLHSRSGEWRSVRAHACPCAPACNRVAFQPWAGSPLAPICHLGEERNSQRPRRQYLPPVVHPLWPNGRLLTLMSQPLLAKWLAPQSLCIATPDCLLRLSKHRTHAER